ncbi:MAG: molybdopterin cofactor-binding domain-containing protein [Candidatus Entotheonellia bacterium]
MATDHQVNRRQFLLTTSVVGGAFVLGFFLPSRQVEAATIAEQPWTSPTTGGTEINAWLVISRDDMVTIRVAQSEMGEGVFTSMPMLVAEELQCDWTKVRAEYASANRSLRENRVYQRMATGGSGAVRRSREYLQQAGASARARLITAAAQQWGVPASECRAEHGVVMHQASNRQVNYGAIAATAATVKLDAEPAIKTPDQFKLLGQSLNRLDVPLKVNGTAIYGIDVRLPDMLYASVMTCPVFGGKLKRYDVDAIKTMPGVRTAVEVPHGIAVVADSFWRAKTALEVMPIEWELGPHAHASSEAFWKTFREALGKPGVVAGEKGDALAALNTAAKVVEADYFAPYLAHATMEPMNCTAQVTPERVDVWVSTQNPEAALAAAAETAGVAPENTYVHTCFLGGGFGRRFYNDDVRQAVTVAKALGGRPVQLIWTREEDMRHDFYRPMAAIRFRAGLDANGVPVTYFNRSVTHSILSGIRPDDVKGGIDRTSVEGLANMPYGFAQHRIEHLIQNTHVPVAFWRSVGASQNAFAVESFLDEVAHAGGKDPVELRRLLLKEHPDWLHVLDTAAQKANWGKTMPAGTAQGIAIAESFGSIVAEVAEVSVSKRGEVRVERVVCAVDCGHVVNPLTVAEQMESSVVYGLTAALYGQITIKDGRVVEGNFDDYQMLRLDTMPEVETHLALTGGTKWGGIGEPGVPPVAPAVCNAIFKVTGRRVRSLPLSNHDLNWT